MKINEKYYVLMHVDTGKLMPQRIGSAGGRGWTHWEPTSKYATYGKTPRLFATAQQARVARTYWAKGALAWKYSESDGLNLLKPITLPRNVYALAVVEVTLKGEWK